MIIRQLDIADLPRLREIDRSERIRRIYRFRDGVMEYDEVDFEASRWSEEQIREFIADLTPELESGGVFLGALDGDGPGGETLAGVAVLGNHPLGERSDLLQLVFLHVSRPYRRRGVASALMDVVCRLARERGARGLYISATESDSAVGFYTGRGARPIEQVDPELFAREPDDIHLLLEL
ncbi:MAG TPA: GNAT family N-acetyltransferase [Chloroflexi bacterium]|jgi:GNAT superfamily N-acetyltransferase|nr:GNAT family N-acetyltransferase [Chloroflexota bacterium]